MKSKVLTRRQTEKVAQIVQEAMLRKTGDVHLSRREIVHAVIDDLAAAGWLSPPRMSLRDIFSRH